jgi:hypothetical protein
MIIVLFLILPETVGFFNVITVFFIYLRADTITSHSGLHLYMPISYYVHKSDQSALRLNMLALTDTVSCRIRKSTQTLEI